jgi:hypothetical protein
VSLHFTHPAELTPEVERACCRLADAGIPLGSQTVLLKGINDDPSTLGALWQGLMRRRVRPYYLYQCDPILGSAHFRTPVRRGLELIQSLRGHTSGYAIPTYVIDAPGGGGKIPLLSNYVERVDATGLWLKSFTGSLHHYPDPSPPEERHTPVPFVLLRAPTQPSSGSQNACDELAVTPPVGRRGPGQTGVGGEAGIGIDLQNPDLAPRVHPIVDPRVSP